MSDLTEKELSWLEKRQSRRGFVALCGKVVTALGLAMAGAHGMPRRVFAGLCCTGTPKCGTGPFGPCTGGGATCPVGCTGGATHVCCDQGYVGATNTVHQCLECSCGGLGTCWCEFDTGVPC